MKETNIGIYRWVNLITGQSLIGQSSNIRKRKYEYLRLLKKNKYLTNKYFQRAWNKYGEENFSFEILENCKIDNLTNNEQAWADHFKQIDVVLYNVGEITSANRRGTKHSKETINKIKEYLNGPNNACLGIKHSKETIEKMKMAKILKAKPILGSNINSGEKLFFESLTEAERNGFNRRHIINCINGERKHHKNFKWRLVNVPKNTDI